MTNPTWETFYDVVIAYSRKHGADKEKSLLFRIAGEKDAAKVDESKYAAVIEAMGGIPAPRKKRATESAAWKAIEKSTMHGHAKVFTGLKRGA